jgi:cation transport ATPase
MEPVYKWEPVTEEYKAQAAESVNLETIEAENQQKLRELHEAAASQKRWVEKKAPIGIRVFTWYLFGRAGFYLLLMCILAAFPQSSASTWLVGSLGHLLPGAAAHEEAAKQNEEMRKDAEAQGIQLPDDAADEQSPEQSAQNQREVVMVFLLFSAIMTGVVGFMWWNHSWKVRWIAMFYAGAYVAKAAIGFFAGLASGVGSEIEPGQMPMLMAAIAVNGLVFCYLAFWPGVKEWFEGQQ